jgi:hypothetical protein
MASVTGTTIGRARATIETAERLSALPATTEALLAGSLSEAQVDVIASAATANPRSEAVLLRTARTDGVKGLKTEAARVEAAASADQDERYRRAIGRRYLRHRRVSDVEGMIEMRGPIDRTARVMAALEPIERAVFAEARAAETKELPEALAFDAMVRLADDAARVTGLSDGRRAPATVGPGRPRPTRRGGGMSAGAGAGTGAGRSRACPDAVASAGGEGEFVDSPDGRPPEAEPGRA